MISISGINIGNIYHRSLLGNTNNVGSRKQNEMVKKAEWASPAVEGNSNLGWLLR